MEIKKAKFGLNDADRRFWEEPHKHILIKERNNEMEYYSVYTIEPILMMLLCYDFEYCLQLSGKMLESGVRVFDNFSEFSQWYKSYKNEG